MHGLFCKWNGLWRNAIFSLSLKKRSGCTSFSTPWKNLVLQNLPAITSGHRYPIFCICVFVGGTLVALHAPRTAQAVAVHHTLQLWHERLNHQAPNAVKRATQHVDSNACLPHITLPTQLASSPTISSLPPCLKSVQTDSSGSACVSGTVGALSITSPITDHFTHWRWLRLLTFIAYHDDYNGVPLSEPNHPASDGSVNVQNHPMYLIFVCNKT